MAKNWLDRAVEAVAPQAGLRRAQARLALTATSAPTQRRGYEGAAQGRLGGFGNGNAWFTSTSSADTEIWGAARALRDRSRDLVRNNPHAAKAVAALVSNIIGDGIAPRPKTGDVEKDKKVKAVFDRWSKSAECDSDGQLDWAGMQTLACREMIEGGEVLIRRRIRRPTDGFDVPLQLQLLEADYLDSFRNGILDGGNQTIQGVEFNTSGPQIGKRAAYWLFPQHPGSLFLTLKEAMVSKPVPASEVLHIYEKQRMQARGVPWGTPAFPTLQNLADYELAEIVRKKLEACNVGVVTTEDDAEIGANRIDPSMRREAGLDDLPVGAFDGNGAPVETFEPGMFIYARGGKTVSFNNPATIGGYNEYKVSQLRTAAAGYRCPYELLSNDLSQVNFSSIRSGLLEFRRFVSAVQKQILIPSMIQPQWDWFTEAAYLAGQIDDPYVPVEWALPRFEWVNPVDDVMADNMAMRSGQKSWEDVVAAGGRDPETVYQEIMQFQKRCAKDGVILDSDPSAVSGKGVAQKNEPPGAGKADAPLAVTGDRSFADDLAKRSAENNAADRKR